MRETFLRPILGFVAVVACFGVFDVAVAQDGSTRSTLDGVYTEEQAQRGEGLNQNICAECHEDGDFTYLLMESWVGATVNALYEVISTEMPEDDPGSLAPEQYADVLAYIFRMNGMPPGSTALDPTPSTLRNIIIQQKP